MVRIRIWLDAMTSKQGTLLGFIARELMNRGHEVLVTCREYEYTVGSIKRLGIDPLVIGRYAEGGSYEKVLADIDRMKGLLNIARSWKPDVLISYPNPPAARVAFGLGIRYVALTDSPHAEIPSRLSLPLADYVLFSSAIPVEEIATYTYGGTKLVTYDSVDEVLWILRCRPTVDYVKDLGLEPYAYVVIRPHEYLATYYRGSEVGVDIIRTVVEVSRMGLTPVVLPRYRNQTKRLLELRDRGVMMKIISDWFDGVSLNYYAVAVITGGGTIAREASLLGTPSVSYFPRELHVDKYVRSKGFPLYRLRTTAEIINFIKNIDVEALRRKNFDDIMRRVRNAFSDPMDTIVSVISSLKGMGG